MRRQPAISLAALMVGLAAGHAWAQQWEPSFPPNPSSTGHNFLMGVSALGADDAWAVGYYDISQGGNSDTYTLAVRWDGQGWAQTPTPSPDTNGAGTTCALNAVEAIGPDDAWAAGYKTIQHPFDGVVGTQLLVLHWDGQEWTEVDAPITPAGRTGAYVRDIKAFGPDDIWFTGLFNFFDAEGASGLAMHWDGSGFTLHLTPNFTQNAEKNQVLDRDAQGNLWIVGMHGRGGFGSHPYVLRGDGDSWDIVGSWSELDYSDLQTIVAFAEDDAWIGMSKRQNGSFVGYVWMHWDGSSWTEHTVPAQYHEPHLVAGGADDIYSGGEASLFHHDGGAWTLVDEFTGVDSPNMNRIDIAPDGSVFGAGRYFPSGAGHGETLAARLLGAVPCDADFNGDGAVNTLDVLAFLNAWSSGDPRGDFNGDGSVNTLDVLAFLNAWSAGC
ncbi:MAG: hypothetical protein IT431_00615 [Phycisphaerales bacterium]|nr:hypothetical protein [Phycisphaerales bacterium]